MRFIALVSILLSTSVLACPNLAGRYAACRSTTGATGGSSDVVITQRASGGVTTYTVVSTDDEDGTRETETMVADGRARSETSEGLTITMIATCPGNSLQVSVAAKQGNRDLGTVRTSSSKQGNEIRHVIRGRIMNQPINDTVVCR